MCYKTGQFYCRRVDPAALKGVAVWGTVVGGRVFPNPEAEAGAVGRRNRPGG